MTPTLPPIHQTDHLIIGGGIAGLKLALNLAKNHQVVVITKSLLTDNNSWHAQGGIASVLSHEDSFESHVQDTLEAGAGLCHPEVVEQVVRKGPDAIADLVARGVSFSKDHSEFHLTKEGGHSKRRVIHAQDLTGQEVIKTLLDHCRKSPNIQLCERMFAIDLMVSDKICPQFEKNVCLGAFVLDRAQGNISQIASRFTYLCTGGHGKVYLYTSNPDSATGDGLAMAWRAGARVGNLEFMQFHPTCLFHPQAKNFLISEALRGEGATLVNHKGEDFIQKVHPLGSLAPRDIVARAIDHEMKKSLKAFVYLDARGLGPKKLAQFPTIAQTCLRFGVDIEKDPIPVVPAAHYSCGGIITDPKGRTNIDRLYALGEVACTGLHGANRLASNSLLEGLVFADLVAADALNRTDLNLPVGHLPPWDTGTAVASDELLVLSHTWDEIRRLMWNYVGIVRSTKRLERALTRIRAIRHELNHYYWRHHIQEEFLEVRNIADAAFLTIRCAMRRKESRGIHYTIDHPAPFEGKAIDTLISG